MSYQAQELTRVLEAVKAHIAKDDAVNPLRLKSGDRESAVAATMIALGVSGPAAPIYVGRFIVFGDESEVTDG